MIESLTVPNIQFSNGSFVAAIVPLWLPLLIIAIPTGFLWWRDCRRRSPGHCQQCGYNLTGNVSGRCPECGDSIEAGR
jgi:hypothetical protein